LKGLIQCLKGRSTLTAQPSRWRRMVVSKQMSPRLRPRARLATTVIAMPALAEERAGNVSSSYACGDAFRA